MKSLQQTILGLFGSLLLSANAQGALITETIDFNNLASGTLISTSNSVGTGDFLYGPPPFGDIQKTLDIGGGNIVMVDRAIDSNGSAARLFRSGGGQFNVLSIDVADLSNNPAGGGGNGGLAGSGFRIGLQGSGFISLSPSSSSFTTIDLSGDSKFQGLSGFFTNLVSGSSDNFAIDNIVVSYEDVPEPGTLLLMGLAASGLIMRRRKTGL